MPAEEKNRNDNKKRMRLGEYLLKEGLVSKHDLADALEKQKVTGEPLGQILIRKHLIEERQVYKILAEQLEVDFMDLFDLKISSRLVTLVPEQIAKNYCIMPVKKENDVLTIAMVNPTDTFAIDELRLSTGLIIKPVISPKSQILDAIMKYYGGVIGEALRLVHEKDTGEEEVYKDTDAEDIERIRQSAEEAPIIKLVNAIICDNVNNRASDIHIEPSKGECWVRSRIDGVLHNITTVPRQSYRAVISRIKIMANMDIAERRLPQDGSFRLQVEEKHIDIRVSTYPTMYGEKLVMRLLVREEAFFSLTELGFEEKELSTFENLIKKPYGIILVVGPTGSGKTTTLYSALERINSREKNIITIEDPIEYEIEGIAQSQINPKAGFTFANSLRSMMRQDPDIILVGEIRDLETAELAVRASLTGHLVFSTLHTNDALGAVTRLVDMGIQPYLISASLIGVLAQRLVRIICPRCREEITPAAAIIEEFKEEVERFKAEGADCRFYQGKGCEFCKNTGYRGREGIFELLQITEHMKDNLTTDYKTGQLKKISREQGFRTLRENGVRKVLRGVTTVEEILQVTT